MGVRGQKDPWWSMYSTKWGSWRESSYPSLPFNMTSARPQIVASRWLSRVAKVPHPSIDPKVYSTLVRTFNAALKKIMASRKSQILVQVRDYMGPSFWAPPKLLAHIVNRALEYEQDILSKWVPKGPSVVVHGREIDIDPGGDAIWSVAAYEDGYASEVPVSGATLLEAVKYLVDEGNDGLNLVKGTQMWNEPEGQVEESDRHAPVYDYQVVLRRYTREV